MSNENENKHTSDNNAFFQAAPSFDDQPQQTPPVIPQEAVPDAAPVAPPAQFIPSAPPKKPARKGKAHKGSKLLILLLVVALCAALAGGLCGGALSYWVLSDRIDLDIDLDDDRDDDDRDDDKDDDDDDDNGNGNGGGDNANNGENPGQNNNNPEQNNSGNSGESDNNSGSTVPPSGELSGESLYEQNVNSTVTVSANKSTGSGFIYSVNGSTAYIVTNHHVVEGGKTFKVTLYDNTELTATLLGSSAASDVAVLKVSHSGLKAVALGNSDNVKVGQTVYAIGNPQGTLPFSMSSGIISGLNRTVTMSGNTTMKLFQTDCPINSGNSGGALFNAKGEVIAIVNAKSSDGLGTILGTTASIDNIGYAIPLNSVIGIIDNFIATDK